MSCKLTIFINNCINFCTFACFLLPINKVTKIMENKRILYVSSEVVPYLAENEVSLIEKEVGKVDKNITLEEFRNYIIDITYIIFIVHFYKSKFHIGNNASVFFFL